MKVRELKSIKNKFYLNQTVKIRDCDDEYKIGLISLDAKMCIWYQLYRISDRYVCSIREHMIEDHINTEKLQ